MCFLSSCRSPGARARHYCHFTDEEAGLEQLLGGCAGPPDPIPHHCAEQPDQAGAAEEQQGLQRDSLTFAPKRTSVHRA